MPRRTKEQIESENKEKEAKKVKTTSTNKAATTKKTTKSKDEPVKKEAKATTRKKSTTTKQKTTAASKKSTTKKAATTKKSTTKKASSKTTKKSTTKKTTTRKKATTKAVKIAPVEYYDLPYRYNQTVVKVLAQTPSTLFIYWDISDDDRKNYEKEYGEDFFQNSKPVLIIYNVAAHYIQLQLHNQINKNQFSYNLYHFVAFLLYTSVVRI